MSAARNTMIVPGDFAWGCQEMTLPGGEIALGDIFLLYAHDGKRILQLLYEPYPEGFPSREGYHSRGDHIREPVRSYAWKNCPKGMPARA